MLENKSILIIGGTGSLGNALVDRYIGHCNQISIYSRGENAQWLMKAKYKANPNLKFYVGDIRDRNRLQHCLFSCKPNIVVIAAALKHVDICEQNVSECINTNVNGVRNVVELISEHAQTSSIPFLETVLFISTDKACSPVNAYGMCKAISERIIIERSELILVPKMLVVRYGNVLSSNGSLLPKFKQMGEDPHIPGFTITDPRMTRFFMTLTDSINLIEYAIVNGNRGETIIPAQIKSYKIKEITEWFSNKYLKPVKITGIRQGEKIHESLISFTEGLRCVRRSDYFVVKPTWENVAIQEIDEFSSAMTSVFDPTIIGLY